MAIAKDLTISSTYFPQKDIHKQTWISPDGHKNQIDHVLKDKKHKGCINNVSSYRGADVESDHYLLITQFKLKLSCRWRRKNTETKRFDIGKLKNKEVAKKYEQLIQNKLAQNTGIHGENEVENQWSRVIQAIKECATDVVGWTEKTKRKDWFNGKCRESIAKRTKLRYKMIQKSLEENRKEYEQGRKETHAILRSKQRQYMQELIATVEENRNNPKQFFECSGRIKQGCLNHRQI